MLYLSYKIEANQVRDVRLYFALFQIHFARFG